MMKLSDQETGHQAIHLKKIVGYEEKTLLTVCLVLRQQNPTLPHQAAEVGAQRELQTESLVKEIEKLPLHLLKTPKSAIRCLETFEIQAEMRQLLRDSLKDMKKKIKKKC